MPEIRGTLKLPRQPSAPSSPIMGQMYYDTTANEARWFDGTLWWPAKAAPGATLPSDIVVPATTRIISNKLLVGDTQPAFRMMGDGRIDWGPGGSAALDTYLARTAANSLYTPGALTAQTLISTSEIFLQNAKAFIDAGGGLTFGPGDWTRDASIYRTGAYAITTNAQFAAAGQVISKVGTAQQIALGDDGRIYFGSAGDTNLYRPSANILQTDDGFRADALHIYNNAGLLYFGNPADVNIARVAAGQLRTSGILEAMGYMVANSASAGQIWLHPDGGIYFGISADTQIKRTAAGQLQTDGDFKILGGLKGGGRVGEVCKSITDWNTAIENGWYMGAAIANQPVADGGWYIGEVVCHNPSWNTQRAWSLTSGAGSTVYERKFLNGVWSAWVALAGPGTPVSDSQLPSRLQATSPQMTDCNACVASGWYCLNGPTNSPIGVANNQGFLNVNVWQSNGYITQLWYTLGTNETYMRQMVGGTWQAWVKTYPASASNVEKAPYVTVIAPPQNVIRTDYYGMRSTGQVGWVPWGPVKAAGLAWEFRMIGESWTNQSNAYGNFRMVAEVEQVNGSSINATQIYISALNPCATGPTLRDSGWIRYVPPAAYDTVTAIKIYPQTQADNTDQYHYSQFSIWARQVV